MPKDDQVKRIICIFLNGGMQTDWLIYLFRSRVHKPTSMHSFISPNTKVSFKKATRLKRIESKTARKCS